MVPKSLIIFAHGSGSGQSSPRNQYVANILNDNGFATLLVDLLTVEEQDSDVRTQKVMYKIPGLVLNKFNIRLLTKRLVHVTNWLLENTTEVKDIPIGYFGSSTGAAAALETSVDDSLFAKVYSIVSRGGRPDLANSDSIKNVKAAILLVVGSRDSKHVIELNKRTLKQLKNAKSNDLIMIPNAGHLFEEENTIEQVADIASQWFMKTLDV